MIIAKNIEKIIIFAKIYKYRPALRAERLQFPKEIEGKSETFRSELRAERLKFHKEIEVNIEKFRSTLRAERPPSRCGRLLGLFLRR